MFTNTWNMQNSGPYTYANTDLLTHYNSNSKQTHMNTKTMNSKQHAHRHTYTYKIKNLKSGFCIVDGKWMKEKIQKVSLPKNIKDSESVLCDSMNEWKWSIILTD